MKNEQENKGIVYDWNCRTVDAYPTAGEFTEVIYNVHWIVTGSDNLENPTRATVYGTQVLNTSEITEFTPFNELTNDQIVEWTKSTMGEEKIAEIEANISKQIELLINPISITLTIEN
jgi:hypothetical protein